MLFMKKHNFLKAVVRLCLTMMCFLTFSVFFLAWHSGEQLDSTTVSILMGGWCGELLIALLRRHFDREDKIEEDLNREEIQNDD